eukprot:2097700-Ditylum_brightwellii.AAC.1
MRNPLSDMCKVRIHQIKKQKDVSNGEMIEVSTKRISTSAESSVSPAKVSGESSACISHLGAIDISNDNNESTMPFGLHSKFIRFFKSPPICNMH